VPLQCKCRKLLQSSSLQLTYKSYEHIQGFEDIRYELSFLTQSTTPMKPVSQDHNSKYAQ